MKKKTTFKDPVRIKNKTPKRPGPPTKYTPERVEEICKYVRLGMRYVDAARCAGIALSTFMLWKLEIPEFLETLEDAVQKAKARNLAIINAAAPKEYRAAAWILEHRHVEEFGRTRTELTGANGKPLPPPAAPVVVDLKLFAFKDKEELKAKLDAILRPRKSRDAEPDAD